MNLAAFANNFLQIDVGTIAGGKAAIEGGSGFTSRFTNLVGFKRPFDHIGYRTIFTTSKSMSQIACFRATHRELWFSHFKLRFWRE